MRTMLARHTRTGRDPEAAQPGGQKPTASARSRLALGVTVWGLLTGGVAGCAGSAGASDFSGFHAVKLREMDAAVTNAISQGKLPGGVLWLEHDRRAYSRAYGWRAVTPDKEAMTIDTIFDAASLTKVIATTPAVMRLMEEGRLRLSDPVRIHLPEFQGQGTSGITIQHLLTHTSGLRPGISLSPAWSGYEKAVQLACQERALKPPGTAFRYSDINFILLGEVVRRLSGMTLDVYVLEEFYKPLQMVDTGFLPPSHQRARIAPTEKTAEGVLRGVVHDPTSRRMGGVAGHAGLFTTARDLARFARMLLNLGELDGVRVFKADTVRLMTMVQTPEAVAAHRGLGWDIGSPYAGPRGTLFPPGSYGHTGWTGTSLWIDPFSRTFLIFLSNRNHPTEDGTVVALRKTLGTLAAQALAGFDFAPKTTVLQGIDVLVEQGFAPLRRRRVGLITNHTGRDRRRFPTIDLLQRAPGVELRALFSPEHGLRGERDEAIEDGIDGQSGLPVYSLYGERKAPQPAQLEGLDALVFDIQDIGCRFYTYISTMGLSMEAAARAGLKFYVLDRVNPINGVAVEGPVYHGPSSFVAYHALPLRHGMTVGELARMFVAEKGLDLELTVIPLQGWKREMWFDETGLPWTDPSPNMRNLKEAILYPGIGLLEMAVSVGRGTDTPFEVFGAPYAGDVSLAGRLGALDLAGVRFVPVQFTPSASLFAGGVCRGVYMLLTEREQCRVVDVGMAAAAVLQREYPGEFDLGKFNRLLLDDRLVEAVRQGRSVEEMRGLWAEELAAFEQRRRPFLLYP